MMDGMQHDHGHGGQAGHDHGGSEEHPIDFHGMLVVGEETVYLSHLPMFDHPNHDIQAILEVTFTNEGSDPQATYANDRKETQTRTYTLAPEKFFLPDLASTDPAHPPRRSFRGRILQGDFRAGAKEIATAVVNVVNIVHCRKFDPDTQGFRQLR